MTALATSLVGWPRLPCVPRVQLPALVFALVATSTLGCPHQTPTETVPLLTTDDPRAESDLRAAREAADGGRAGEAARRYQEFLTQHPHDPLVPLAQLGLGEVLLAQGDSAAALERFRQVAASTDAATAERGRFYEGVALQLGGHPREALELLRPLAGRTIDPADTALLLRTIAAAAQQTGDRVGAVRALDSLLAAPVPDDEKVSARTQLEQLVTAGLTADEVQSAEQVLPHDGYGWPRVAKRALREAYAAHDLGRVRELAAALRAAHVELDGELGDMALRAALPEQASPNVVGAILPLSGRGREAGERALRGLMIAAGLPETGPTAPGAPQLVLRDTAGDPERAVHAVEELASLHRAIAIVGPIDGAEALAAAARARELGVPLVTLTPAPGVTQAGAFRLFPTLDAEVRALAHAAKARGARSVAALSVQGPYGDAVSRALGAACNAEGLTALPAQSYAAGTTTFTEQARALRAANPDAVLLADTARTIALVAPALAAAGLVAAAPGATVPAGARAVTLLVPSVGFDEGVARSSGRYLQGALFAAPFVPSLATGSGRAFADAYSQQYGGAPDVLAASARDAWVVVRAAVDSGARTRADLAARLPAQADADTLTGVGGLGADREPRRGPRLVVLAGTAFAAAP